MTELRKYALFQMGVAGLAAVAVAVAYALFHDVLASLAGFALLALLGLRAVLLRGRGGTPIQDERDEAIHRQATVAGYVALWLALVAWGVAVPLLFADRGAVPLGWVAPVVWVAWWLVACVRSVTILVLDRRGG